MAHAQERIRVWKYQEGLAARAVDDEVVSEEPLEIRISGRGVGITMRTPGEDEDLVLGFLVGEGVIASYSQVAHLRRCDRAEGDLIDVLPAAGLAVDFAALTRHVFASSSCGVCGSASVEVIRKRFGAVAGGQVVPSKVLHGLGETLRTHQQTFDRTGGLHAAGLFDLSGGLVSASEDVGRHNAVDKVVGRALRMGMLPLSAHVLLVSGRASFEIVQKAAAAGIAIVAAVSAPSSLAVDLAAEANITLAGFVRGGRFNVYTHRQRIVD